ncbi:ammonium transporter [Flavisolibacter ginsenosidimutans]|uniref:Ammonium transporter n=1 Tax=Flavisolibacter ginsenosidimutans TaxID=661481 RepID=A0A5B8UHB3_9BACT|nr:ammonium transporter [Flavisolibacter ginsenosidimutans]QEC55903.1 ammonium transporter [Flavisolibacter ginsenosidimutans]
MNKITLKSAAPFVVLVAIAVASLFVPTLPNFDAGKYVPADIAWIIVAAALVFLMTPGLAFFYGGMVHRKNILSTMMKSVVAAGVVGVLWVVVGYSLCFGESVKIAGLGFIGSPKTHLFFKGVASGEPWVGAPTIPKSLFAAFQLMFAIITPGLVVGAIAERMRFVAYVLFTVLFSLLVYAPLAHWSWHPDGFLAKMGALDFAGGTVVHISAGCAALAGALVLKRRKAHIENIAHKPANIPYILIGTGLLWFGWFGFNAGSALGANATAVSAFMTTNTAAAAAGLSWMFFDVLRGKKPSVVGFCVGAVVGLVAITPAAGYVAIAPSIFIGVVAALISNVAVYIKSKSSLDDTLDVFPCHGVGGMVGMLMTGIFASKAIYPAGSDGWAFGNFSFFLTQVKAMGCAVGYSFVVSFLIFKFINFIVPLRVSDEDEEAGLDASQHDENYVQGTLLVTTEDGVTEKEIHIDHVFGILAENGHAKEKV